MKLQRWWWKKRNQIRRLWAPLDVRGLTLTQPWESGLTLCFRDGRELGLRMGVPTLAVVYVPRFLDTLVHKDVPKAAPMFTTTKFCRVDSAWATFQRYEEQA